MSKTKIPWAGFVWNPTTGCTEVSPGCANCYAEEFARRLQSMNGGRNNGYQNGFTLTLQPERLGKPLQRRKPTIYFVNSMSDLFHRDVPDHYIARVFDVIAQATQHVFLVLTKRPERMVRYFRKHGPPPANAWMGVTVENRQHGLPRIELLRHVPAQVRFISAEPLLEDLGDLDLTGIGWVIVGGESAPKARPMREEWVLGIKAQCDAQGAAFFFKHWGSIGPDGVTRPEVDCGRLLLGREWNDLPVINKNLGSK